MRESGWEPHWQGASYLNMQDRGQMLLYINRACHTAVPLKVSRGLPVLLFIARADYLMKEKVGVPVHLLFSRIAGPAGRRNFENWC